MAKWVIKNVKLVGMSGCVPKNNVLTVDMPIFNKEESEKFLENVGIKSRRVAINGVRSDISGFKYY